MFTRKRWTELLIRYGQQEAVKFYDDYKDSATIEIINPPTEGVTMIKVRESAENTLFYLGEVTISETKLRVNGHIGLGVLHGNLIVSEALAFIDACYPNGLFTDEMDQLLQDLKMKEQEIIAAKTNEIMKTKVDFETMDV